MVRRPPRSGRWGYVLKMPAQRLFLSAANPLTKNLISFWRLGEANGANRVDYYGTNTLTNNNTVTQVGGKVGNASQFVAASSQSLSIADNASLSTGDIDFTIVAWVYLDSKAAEGDIIAKDASGQREYNLRYVSVGDRFNFTVSNDGTATTSLDASTLGSPSTSTWYFLVAWHDSIANTINIQANDGTVDSVAHTTGVFDGTAAFGIGTSTFANTFFDGRIDAVGFWKRVLSSSERSFLYNSGNGIELRGEYLWGIGP